MASRSHSAFTLLGVAQEYPIRVFSHRRAGASVGESLAGVWPLLRLAIVSACIAYLAFLRLRRVADCSNWRRSRSSACLSPARRRAGCCRR